MPIPHYRKKRRIRVMSNSAESLPSFPPSASISLQRYLGLARLPRSVPSLPCASWRVEGGRGEDTVEVALCC
jgi:hypothetical protein